MNSEPVPYDNHANKWGRSLLSAETLLLFVAAVMVFPFNIERGLWVTLGAFMLLFVERRTALLDRRLRDIEVQFQRLTIWEQQLQTATQHVEATLNHVNGVGANDETQVLLLKDDFSHVPPKTRRPVHWTDEVDS